MTFVGEWAARVEDRRLLTGRGRFVDDLVAMVVAESRYIAEDGCDLAEVDYDPLPAVTGYDAALDSDAPATCDELGDNILDASPPITLRDVGAAFTQAMPAWQSPWRHVHGLPASDRYRDPRRRNRTPALR
ncbi:hypothetical protein [Pseudofrankia sp. BMG5.36]|uniref:hypothetical protein n=1 Tax=Pseudofrankia sp. BMG5.36 TaxID=1834512 RepID=UPI0008DAC1BB|nr:hypothetical protein [Pseudofrankia sp. BMG5.36]OHV43533.1 hypothetical protein BCD48_27525 [Pseudofrankia sp. BMG5.36]